MMMAAPAERDEEQAWRLELAADRVALEELEGRFLLVRLDDGRCFDLNATGMFLWRCLEAGPCSQRVLVSRIAEAARVERDQVTGDVGAFLEQLQRHGLIRAAR
jgi:hypothetical protein